MPDYKNCIEEVSALIGKQQRLLNLSLFVLDKGRALYEGHELVCKLSTNVRNVVTHLSFAGGQSTVTILEFAKKRGSPVRDCFPVARSAIETLINATYVLAGGEDLAKQAMRHAGQKAYRDLDRNVGRGDYVMHIYAATSPMPNQDQLAELKKSLGEFTSVQGREKSWTDDSVPMRVEKIGKKFGAPTASGLLGAYALIYGNASEIIHGTLFGTNFFYHGTTGSNTLAEFHAITEQHLESVLFATFMAINSYLSAFCIAQDFPLERLLKDNFDEFLRVVRNKGQATKH
jgi:hypothetical protein